ncbi:hypothetical protein [Actinoplanes sp. CA-252034]|uniref:hypothetical protein n=1 Tax=Actinoplanes sp. CA-252034 TaxID=3239906 RepID=UPI003D96F564
MADFRPPAPFPFPLVYVAASTFYLLGSAERQLSCLKAVAGTLARSVAICGRRPAAS